MGVESRSNPFTTPDSGHNPIPSTFLPTVDSPSEGFYVIDAECSARFMYITIIRGVTVDECARRCRAYTACFLFIYCVTDGSSCKTGK